MELSGKGSVLDPAAGVLEWRGVMVEVLNRYEIFSKENGILLLKDPSNCNIHRAYKSNQQYSFQGKYSTFPKIVHSFEDKNVTYIVEEEIKGISLDKIQKRLDPDEIVSWIIDLCGDCKQFMQETDGCLNPSVEEQKIALTTNNKLLFMGTYDIKKYKCEAVEQLFMKHIGILMEQLLQTNSYTLQGIIKKSKESCFSSIDEFVRALEQYHSVDQMLIRQRMIKRPKKENNQCHLSDIEVPEILFWQQNDDVNHNEDEVMDDPRQEEFLPIMETEDLDPAMPQLQIEVDEIPSNQVDEEELVSEPIISRPLQDSEKVKFKDIINNFIPRRLLYILGAALIITSIIAGFAIHNKQQQEKYINHIQISARTTRKGDKIKECKAAINIYPGKVDAYEQLLAVYTEDAVLDLKEEEDFLSTIHDNWSKLKKNQDYGVLAYQIGRAYWYYYNYGTDKENEVTRIKSAMQWFDDSLQYEDTKKYHSIAKIYYEIGKFNRDIILSVETGEDGGVYKKYFYNLKKIVSLEKANDIARLELYHLIINSIKSYDQNFMNDGIKVEEIQKMQQETLSKTKDINPTSQKARALKDSILKNGSRV